MVRIGSEASKRIGLTCEAEKLPRECFLGIKNKYLRFSQFAEPPARR
jgi:hypothetical protein